MDLGSHGNVFLASESHPLAVLRSETISLHVHPTSRYVTACDELYHPYPVLVLLAGVRRPGYEAAGSVDWLPSIPDICTVTVSSCITLHAV